MVTITSTESGARSRRPPTRRSSMSCATILSCPARSSVAAWRSAEPVRSCWTARKSAPASRRSRPPPARKSPRSKGFPRAGRKQKGLSAADAEKTLHPVQQAWIEEQTPLCGFCQNGMMIKATELLEQHRHADRRRDQRGIHDFGSVGASVPLRQLHRHHRGRAARRHGHGEEARLTRWPISRTKIQSNVCFGAALSRAAASSKPAARCSSASASSALTAARNPRKPPPPSNTLDATLPESWIEIHPDNTILIRTGKSDFGQSTDLHRLSPDRRRRTERAVRSHHHRRDGRHRSHSRRQRRLRFSRPRHAEHPQSRGVHLSGPARSGRRSASAFRKTSSP